VYAKHHLHRRSGPSQLIEPRDDRQIDLSIALRKEAEKPVAAQPFSEPSLTVVGQTDLVEVSRSFRRESVDRQAELSGQPEKRLIRSVGNTFPAPNVPKFSPRVVRCEHCAFQGSEIALLDRIPIEFGP